MQQNVKQLRKRVAAVVATAILVLGLIPTASFAFGQSAVAESLAGGVSPQSVSAASEAGVTSAYAGADDTGADVAAGAASNNADADAAAGVASAESADDSANADDADVVAASDDEASATASDTNDANAAASDNAAPAADASDDAASSADTSNGVDAPTTANNTGDATTDIAALTPSQVAAALEAGSITAQQLNDYLLTLSDDDADAWFAQLSDDEQQIVIAALNQPVTIADDQYIAWTTRDTSIGTTGEALNLRWMIYVRKSGTSDAGTLGYCFNATKTIPAADSKNTSAGPATYGNMGSYSSPYNYAQYADGTGFDNYADNVRTSALLTGDDGNPSFAKTIRNVVYYGYRGDGSSDTAGQLAVRNAVKAKYEADTSSPLYGKSFDLYFYHATQYAIWYYTDSVDLPSGKIGEAAQLIIDAATEDAEASLSSQYKLNLFTQTNQTKDMLYSSDPNQGNYQNVLTISPIATTDTPTDTPTSETGSLSVSKTVTDSSGATLSSDTTAFTFTVALGSANANKSYQVTVGSTTSTVTTDSSGNLALSLTGGQTATIAGIAANTSYTVTETAVSGYTQTSSSGVSGTITANTTSAAYFTNQKDADTPTPTPSTPGLSISKSLVDQYGNTITDDETAFSFTLNLKGAYYANGNYYNLSNSYNVYYSIDGGTSQKATISNGNVTFTLKAGQTITFTDFSYSYSSYNYSYIQYTVTETAPSGDYSFNSVAGTSTDSHSETQSSRQATGTFARTSGIATVSYTNTKTVTVEPEYGSLEVSKALVDASGDATTDATTSFSFTVTLKNADGTAYAGAYTLTKTDANGTAGTTESLRTTDGTVTFTLKGGEKAALGGLLAGTTYTVVEGETPSYYSLKSINTNEGASQAEGTITTTVSQAAFVNQYSLPTPTGVNANGSPFALITAMAAGLAMFAAAFKLRNLRKGRRDE